MKLTEYLNRLSQNEIGNYMGGLSEVLSNEYYEEDYLYNGMYPIPSIWGKRTSEEDELYQKWNNALGDMSLDLTPFRDAWFLRTFRKDISEKEQDKYIYNTALYCNDRKDYDPNYVIVTRRALPSLEDKPEQFWTSEYREVLCGLSNEIPKESPHRIHSVILVSTLATLEKYGFAFNNGGVTDGEIMINNVPFDRKDILFIHKSDKEIKDLLLYLINGGLHNKDVLEIVKKNIKERQNHYNGLVK